jgi:CRISPR-associated protein Csb1
VGDKVFPPTYAGGKYAVEERVIGGQRVPCVLLDSVQSQANRMELALLEATRAGKIQVPLVEVDFAGADGLADVGTLTSLEAPHRLADAYLRDSTLNGMGFRQTDEGRSLSDASVVNATPLLDLCPSALVFGVWDSTGPKGGLGTKFQRCIVSEIAGIGVVGGAKVSSRVDPFNISASLVLYNAADATLSEWTLNPDEAQKDRRGNPVLFDRGRGEGKAGSPAKANLGNITPSVEAEGGGITMAYAQQTVVISLPALRRLRFPVAGTMAADRDLAARAVLAALGLCGATLSIEAGCDLRSRCLLVPEPGQGGWEVVLGDGTTVPFALDAGAACGLLNAAVAEARAAGLPWRTEPLRLTPSPGLAALVRRSREMAMQAGADEPRAET